MDPCLIQVLLFGFLLFVIVICYFYLDDIFFVIVIVIVICYFYLDHDNHAWQSEDNPLCCLRWLQCCEKNIQTLSPSFYLIGVKIGFDDGVIIIIVLTDYYDYDDHYDCYDCDYYDYDYLHQASYSSHRCCQSQFLGNCLFRKSDL